MIQWKCLSCGSSVNAPDASSGPPEKCLGCGQANFVRQRTMPVPYAVAGILLLIVSPLAGGFSNASGSGVTPGVLLFVCGTVLLALGGLAARLDRLASD